MNIRNVGTQSCGNIRPNFEKALRNVGTSGCGNIGTLPTKGVAFIRMSNEKR